MNILLENLGGASTQPNTVQENIEDTQILKKGEVPNESDFSEGMLIQKWICSGGGLFVNSNIVFI